MATGHISVNIEDILTKFGTLVSCTNSTLYVKFGLISSCIVILIDICNVTEGAHPCKFFCPQKCVCDCAVVKNH